MQRDSREVFPVYTASHAQHFDTLYVKQNKWGLSIQFISCSPISQITNLPSRALQSVHRRHLCPKTSHRIRKNSQEIEKKTFTGKKREETFRRETGGSLSRMDRSNRCHVTRRNHYRVTAHSMNMTDCMNESGFNSDVLVLFKYFLF